MSSEPVIHSVVKLRDLKIMLNLVPVAFLHATFNKPRKNIHSTVPSVKGLANYRLLSQLAKSSNR